MVAESRKRVLEFFAVGEEPYLVRLTEVRTRSDHHSALALATISRTPAIIPAMRSFVISVSRNA
jgi:hypothetical protein